MSEHGPKIVSIVDYPAEDTRTRRMTYAFLDSVIAGGAASVTLLYEQHRPCVAPEHRRAVDLEIVQGRSVDVGHPHPNLRFKLANLAALPYPFLFLDADTYVLGNLNTIWQYRHDQPWIGINHQWVPSDVRTHRSPFLNSGVQLVADPSFYDLEAILAVQNAVMPLHRHRDVPKNVLFPCPGFDQAILFRYFTSIGYDYTHPHIGPEWNSCAGVTRVEGEPHHWHATTFGLSANYPVQLIHYSSQFKPWAIDCPIYAAYADV
ncbi:MAG: hypothetical protein LC104_11560 [Bacteroidales bacterium]|nr:hypothetical protein [Bacteroidales bacterium]